MPTMVKSRPWGKGELSVGLDLERGKVVAYFEAQGKTWGPAELMEIPEGWPISRYNYLVDNWWSTFDAKMGGDRFFSEKFDDEAAALAYGSWRRKAEAARKVIGHDEAAKIADSLIEAFYAEARPGKTPFDNWALANKLSELTFGKFDVDQIMKLLEKAADRYHESQ
jgi:hypothetical protein